MTAYEDVQQRMRDAFEMLENIALEQASAEPKRTDKVKKALKDVTAALEAAEAWQREQEGEQRLALLFDELTRYTRKADKRLRVAEARLRALEKADGSGGRRQGVKPNRALIAEGKLLAGMLEGPPDDGLKPAYFKDAARGPVVPAVDLLAVDLASRVKTTKTRAKA